MVVLSWYCSRIHINWIRYQWYYVMWEGGRCHRYLLLRIVTVPLHWSYRFPFHFEFMKNVMYSHIITLHAEILLSSIFFKKCTGHVCFATCGVFVPFFHHHHSSSAAKATYICCLLGSHEGLPSIKSINKLRTLLPYVSGWAHIAILIKATFLIIALACTHTWI